jgi:hypothetical protein
MFVQMKQIPARAADMFDLAIEFSTLGEYGLEYPEEAAPGSCRRTIPACRQANRDQGAADGGRRARTRSLRGSPRRLRAGKSGIARTHSGTPVQSGRPVAGSGLPEALRPPRIELSFN